jgi:hypothetical protein
MDDVLYVKLDGATTVVVTVIVTLAVPEPTLLVAVIVYSVEAIATVGVPEITPANVSNVNPAGSVGDIFHDVAALPVFIAVSGVIATFVTPLMLCLLYVITGAADVIVILTVSLPVPALLVAVMT